MVAHTTHFAATFAPEVRLLQGFCSPLADRKPWGSSPGSKTGGFRARRTRAVSRWSEMSNPLLIYLI